jgi:polar amino acid transport system substrate-binding protein
MEQMMSIRLKILLLSVLLLFCGVQAATAETLSVRADLWPPYNDEPKSLRPGYMIMVLMEIFLKQGYSLDYQTLSWEESLKAVREGQFNAVIGASRDDAPDFIFPQESFGVSDTSFFVSPESQWKFAGIGSLKRIRLGVIEDYAYEEALDAYIKANKGTGKIVVSTGDDPMKNLIFKLQNGHIDAIVEDSNVMMSAILSGKIPLKGVVSAGSLKEKSEVYIAFSPKNPKSKELAAKFDAGIRNLRGSGRLKAILGLYGLTDWKKN